MVVILSGCTTVPKMCQTASGKPEVTIKSTDISLIKSEIITDMMNSNYNIVKDTDYMLEMTRPATSGENFTAGMSIGNTYSTNYRSAIFNLAKLKTGTRVVASLALKAQLPGGQVNSMSMNDNGNVFNSYQQMLMDIQEKVEASK